MHKKKTWKTIDQTDIQRSLEVRNREKEVSAQRQALPDQTFFSVNKKNASLKK